MGYRIQYGPVRRIRQVEKRRSGVIALTGIFFLVFLIIVNLFWPQGIDVIRESLLSEESSLTVVAMEEISDIFARGDSIFDTVISVFK